MTGEAATAYLAGQLIGSFVFGVPLFAGLAWIVGLFAFHSRSWPARQNALVGAAYLIIAGLMILGREFWLPVVMLPAAFATAALYRWRTRPKGDIPG